MTNKEWEVFVTNNVISWIRAVSSSNPNAFENYERAIQNIRNMAKAMTPLNFIACGEGFKIYIKEEGICLRCVYFIEEREIDIVDIIQ